MDEARNQNEEAGDGGDEELDGQDFIDEILGHW